MLLCHSRYSSIASWIFFSASSRVGPCDQQLFNDGASSPAENTSARHGKVAIFGAFDGSAHTMMLTQWAEKAGENVANELWCFPGSEIGQ